MGDETMQNWGDGSMGGQKLEQFCRHKFVWQQKMHLAIVATSGALKRRKGPRIVMTYRGQEDNSHYYRIPKRPPILRQAWLCAIGRIEETVLRICSAHFYGDEKHEGDIPIDQPEFIELPPKEVQ
ncbi:hypothetical protein niasHT_011644 [Heterodera trifolii]|uniref:THAP-type domain-containing protein n=1 Tax=Heterodera trifolii TaxID=157864 RepID=A0ABD2LH19_9BILA